MKLSLELTPNIQPPHIVKDIKRLDKILFSGDKRIDLKGNYVWIIRDQGKAVAYGGMRPCQMKDNEGLVLLTRVGVLPEYQGKGFQKKLIRARVRKAASEGYKEVVVYVRWWNAASINALVGCGFKAYQPAVAYAGTNVVYLKKQLKG